VGARGAQAPLPPRTPRKLGGGRRESNRKKERYEEEKGGAPPIPASAPGSI